MNPKKISEMALEEAIRSVAEKYSEEAAALSAEISESRSELRKIRRSVTGILERLNAAIGDNPPGD